MSLELPTSNATFQVPSTKAWLLLMSLLTGLLLAGSRSQLPASGGPAAALAGPAARPAAAVPNGRRVALKTALRPPPTASDRLRPQPTAADVAPVVAL